MNKLINRISILFLSVFLIITVIQAENKDNGNNKLKKTLGTPNVTRLNINNLSTYIYNDGNSDIDLNGNSGLVYPKGSGKTAVFESGLVWGGLVGGQIRVGGSTYSQGLQPGKIQPDGTPEDPGLDKNRIYRVRPDYVTGNLQTEAREEGISQDEVRSNYERDWMEWPAEDGAPFNDVDSNGIYDPAVDIPGVPDASQTIWFVANDLNPDLTTNLYGAQPMGIEMQATMWAYAQAGALGNMFFRKYIIINKSSSPIEEMYVSMWSDVDLGDASDDFAGCDTTLSLGYCYNASPIDATYGDVPPPAVGFDFFQGPIVEGAPGDSGIFLGKRVYGRRNLPMTAFYYFARGDATVTDPTLASYEGSIQFYRFMQGRIGLTGDPFRTPQGVETKFVLAGNPITGQGWVDGTSLPAGDRRIGSSSGPFTMAVGDTQEVVVAQIVAGATPGVDRLQAIDLLKSYDEKAQEAYDTFFQIPTGAESPNVSAVPQDREVILSWGDPATVPRTESYNLRGFQFQGYNVYQLPSESATLETAQLIATYDLADTVATIYGYVFDPRTGRPELVPVQFGTNSGLQRSIRIDRDFLNGGLPLNNGSRYYYAVTSYSFNPDPLAVPNVLENPISPITVVPQSPNPGVTYSNTFGDTLQTVTHISGVSDGSVVPVVVDPTGLTGHIYRVTFDTMTVVDTAGIAEKITTWTLTDTTTNTVLISQQTNLSGDNDYMTVDGVQVVVAGPPPGMKDWEIPNGDRRWTFAGGAADFHLEGFEGAMGNAYVNWFSGSTVLPENLPHVLIKYAATDTLGNLVDPNDPDASFGYRYLRGATAAAAKPEFAPFIINPVAGYAFQDFTKSVPFAAYNSETGQRLTIGYLENNVEGGLVDGKYWPPDFNVGNNTASTGPREWFFIFNTPYSETLDPKFQVDVSSEVLDMLWMGTPARRGNVAFEAEDEFQILANKVITPEDVYVFSVPTSTFSQEQAQSDINQIKVFPNPYYGVNPQELNKYQRFVTFNHLPRQATIRIFNLSGLMVRQILKDSDSQFERWDLSNENGLPVASGLYIAHIEMPGLGTKILKLAIIQEQQILDRF